MHFNEIDEIIRKGLQANERNAENHAMKAKLRIWDAIEKPKKKSSWNLRFVLATAAALCFFLVSTFLFLKLRSKQEELHLLRTAVNQGMPTIELQENKLKEVEKNIAGMHHEVVEEKVFLAKKVETTPRHQRQKTTQIIDSEVDLPEPEVAQFIRKESIIAEAEIQIPETYITELKAELVPTLELKEETPIETKPKTQSKLRFRIGNSGHTLNSGNSLALNIKL